MTNPPRAQADNAGADASLHADRRRLLVHGGRAVAAGLGACVAAWADRVAAATAAPAAASGTSSSCVAGLVSSARDSPYGPTAPVSDLSTGLALIELPAGFSYRSHGWAGDVMSDGQRTPRAHDGMGLVRARKVGGVDEFVLVRNHELAAVPQVEQMIGAGLDKVPQYDRGQIGQQYRAGGTTNLVWRDGRFTDSWASLGGLQSPCAGGSTAWGSWLANEEVRDAVASSTGKKHGYVFEVAADAGRAEQAAPGAGQPIVAMGRMAHEASAFDPATGYWYLTEDNYNANTLYRFRPHKVQGGLGSLHGGGQLQGLAVRGKANVDLRDPKLCQEFSCEWVDVADPDIDGAALSTHFAGRVAASGPYLQAYSRGAAAFGATEGCWVAGGVVWFTDKLVSLDPARAGRIWTLHLASMTLKAVFVSNSVQVGNSPDNLCVSPRGGVLFCEDGLQGTGPGDLLGGSVQHLKVLHPSGQASIFASHHFNFTRAQLDAVGKTGAAAGDQRRTEWAGAVFSPDGQVLFVNLYTPGMTLAITGPWQQGPL